VAVDGTSQRQRRVAGRQQHGHRPRRLLAVVMALAVAVTLVALVAMRAMPPRGRGRAPVPGRAARPGLLDSAHGRRAQSGTAGEGAARSVQRAGRAEPQARAAGATHGVSGLRELLPTESGYAGAAGSSGARQDAVPASASGGTQYLEFGFER
jgi:hypothetical protein